MSSVINGVVEAVMAMIDGTEPFASIKRGALPSKQGLSCRLGPSASITVHLDKNAEYILNLAINGKHRNLQTLSDTMNNIHSKLTRAWEYSSAESWQITDITNGMLPQVIGREDSGEWLMASSLDVHFYQRGD